MYTGNPIKERAFMNTQRIKVIVIISGIFMGLLVSGISVPLIKGKVPPNGSYGFKTEKTLSSEEVWYKANTYAGKEMFRAGLMLVGVSIVLLIVVRKLNILAVVAVQFLSIVTILAIIILRCVSYLNKI